MRWRISNSLRVLIKAVRSPALLAAAVFATGLLITSVPTPSQAANLVAIGNVNETVDATDLADGAGSELVDYILTNEDALKLHVLATQGSEWRLEARLVNNSWPDDFTVELRRTSAHEDVDGGEYFVGPLEQTYTEFLTGQGNVQNIYVQVRVGGFDLEDQPDLFSSSLVFDLELLN